MPLRLLPDVEALVVSYLKTHTSVVAIAGARVGTFVADGSPRLNITVVTGREIVRDHLDETHIQVDAYALDSVTASLLARTARAALLEAPDATHSRGVVTHVRTITPPQWLPDPVANDRPRYMFEVGVTVHPNPL